MTGNVNMNTPRIHRLRWNLVLGLALGCLGITTGGTTGDALPLVFRDTPKPSYGAAVATTISGSVTLDAAERTTGVDGVSVTDGYSVVKTDAAGDYTLAPNPSAVFISIVRPSGFDVAGAWYKPLAVKVHFALRPAVDDENEYTFVHVTDTHVSGDPIRSRA